MQQAIRSIQHEVIYPDDDDINPDQARYLYEEHCAILILENLPIGSEFGIDLTAYQIGSKFKGVKLIPPGLHFIYAGAHDLRNNQFGPRCGFFHNFKPKELLVKRWSSKDEEFDNFFVADEDVCDRYKSNLRNLDRYLGAYKFSTYKSYLNLTNKLTQSQIARLTPNCGWIRSVPYLESVNVPTTTENSQPDQGTSMVTRLDPTDASSLLPHLQEDQSTVIHFTIIPKNHRDAKYQIAPEQISQFNLDSSVKLRRAFESSSNESSTDTILAEFQYSFLIFILCHVYDCFEHWKTLLGLICKSESNLRLSNWCPLYSQFIQIFAIQVDCIPDDLFLEIDQRNNLIRTHIDNLFQNINESLDIGHVREQIKPLADILQSQLREKFSWEFDLPLEDEDEPVVVDVD